MIVPCSLLNITACREPRNVSEHCSYAVCIEKRNEVFNVHQGLAVGLIETRELLAYRQIRRKSRVSDMHRLP